MKLTLADQLALMLTSAGSQRKLAAYLGASHQQVGRWLKGPKINAITGAITNEPADTAMRANIKAAFQQFKRAVKDTADREGLPYSSKLPVALRRLVAEQDYAALNVRTGEFGFRAVVEHTDTMRAELREAVMADYIRHREFVDVSVRSKVDLRAYFKRGEAAWRGKRGKQQVKSRRSIIQRLERGVTTAPIFTRKTNAMTPHQHPEDIAREVSNLLREKHEPASTEPGNKLADQWVFTTLYRPRPVRDDKPFKQKPKARKVRAHIRGRGPK